MKIFEITIFWLNIAPSYYWAAYALSFIIWYWIIKRRNFLSEKDLDTLFVFIFTWIIWGWRLWYVLFYDLPYYISNPIEIPMMWKWGMSFHGWVIGVLLAMYFFSRKMKFSWIWFCALADEIVAMLPVWLFLWRMWNLINKELLWMKYSWFLSISKNWNSYFPSPLLEWILEWPILFVILNIILRHKKYHWHVWWSFLFFYWIFRFIAEFFRTPDPQLWYILWWWLTMWQILSIPMIIAWIYYTTVFKLFPASNFAFKKKIW